MYTDHTFWRIPIHECCTYIIYIIICIIGGRVLQERVVSIKINARGGGNKIRFYAYHMYVILGWVGEAILTNEVYQRQLYTNIVQLLWWQRHAFYIDDTKHVGQKKILMSLITKAGAPSSTYFCEQTTMVVTNRLTKYRSRGHRRWFSLPTVSLPWLVAWHRAREEWTSWDVMVAFCFAGLREKISGHNKGTL